MKQSMTFNELTTHVYREAERRQDYYVPTHEMQIATDASSSRLCTPCGQFTVKDRAHLHLAEICGIDRRYYQKLRTEAPFLLDRNVNHWLATAPAKQRIVRALDEGGKMDVRAIVSSRYAALDNDALLKTVEPIIDEMGLSVESCDVGDDRLIIKMVSPRLTGAVKVGDEVQAGIVLRNSEVRCSALQIDYFVKRLVCTNGMVVTKNLGNGTFRRHIGRDWFALGRKNGESKGLPYGLIPEDTAREEWECSIWQGLEEAMRAKLNADDFSAMLERFALTTKLDTPMEPDAVVQRVAKTYHLYEYEQEAVLHHLVHEEGAGESVTLWNVLNAVTRTAQDVTDYNRATTLEEIGGSMAHLSAREWTNLVNPN